MPFSKPISCYSFLTECFDQKMTLLLLNSMVSLLLKVTAICQPTLPLCCGHTLCMTPYIGRLTLKGYGDELVHGTDVLFYKDNGSRLSRMVQHFQITLFPTQKYEHKFGS